MPKKTRATPKPAPPLPALAELVKERRNSVHEVLQLWGDFPDCGPGHTCHADWTHVLLTQITDIVEQTRLDASDPVVGKVIRKHLASLIAACEMWDEELTAK